MCIRWAEVANLNLFKRYFQVQELNLFMDFSHYFLLYKWEKYVKTLLKLSEFLATEDGSR